MSEEKHLKRAAGHLEHAVVYLKKADVARLVKVVEGVIREINEAIEEEE